MDKNNIIGIVLIGALLVGYSMFFANNSDEKISSTTSAKTEIVAQQDAKEALASSANTSQEQFSQADSAYLFAQVAQDSASVRQITLGNELLDVVLTTQGAMPVKATLKEHKSSYDGEQVALFKEGDFYLNLPIRSKENRLIDTSKVPFQLLSSTDSSALMRMPIADGSYLDISYHLPHNSYMLEVRIDGKNLGTLFASNLSYQDIELSQRIRRQEKSWKYENQYSTIYYKYPDNSVESLKESKKEIDENIKEAIQWVSFKDKYFSTTLIAQGIKLENNRMSFKTEAENTEYIKKCTYSASFPMDIRDGNKAHFSLFMGPLDYSLLKGLDSQLEDANKMHLEQQVYLGYKLFRPINIYLIMPIVNFLKGFISNWGIIILLLTIIIKTILFPLTYKGFLSQARMRVLRPQIDEINAKYAGDDQKMMMKRSQETMALYRNAGASPMSGCLPMLLQMPFLIALYMYFPTAIDLRGESFLWAQDLSTYDPVIRWSFDIPLITGFLGGNHISLFCLLWAITNIFYTRFTMNQGGGMDNPQMKPMKWMPYIMTVMFFVFFNSNASGLVYYYLVSTLITMALYWISRMMISEEKVLAKIEENKRKPKKKSGFMQRLEQAQKEQERRMKAQRNNPRK